MSRGCHTQDRKKNGASSSYLVVHWLSETDSVVSAGHYTSGHLIFSSFFSEDFERLKIF